MKQVFTHAIALLLLVAFTCCAPKKPEGPPQELLDQKAKVESLYQEISGKYSHPKEQASDYLSLMEEARGLIEAGDYKEASKKLRQAELEGYHIYARLAYLKLQEYSPETSLTYHYRQHMKNSEEAEKQGDIEVAIEEAIEARKQAEYAIDLMEQCLDNARERLDELKHELESLYKPDWSMVALYWDAREALPEKNCARVRRMVQKLDKDIETTKRMTVTGRQTFIVTSSDQFVEKYGNPGMYEEVTPRGLRNMVNRVAVGDRVVFIRSKMMSPETTYYFVEDPRTGIRGWMAEERVWPGRAHRRVRER